MSWKSLKLDEECVRNKSKRSYEGMRSEKRKEREKPKMQTGKESKTGEGAMLPGAGKADAGPGRILGENHSVGEL